MSIRLLSILFVLFSSVSLRAQEDTPPLLTVYTLSSLTADWGIAPHWKKTFEEKYDAQVRYVTFDSSLSLLNRLKLEGKNTKADLVIGFNSQQIPLLEEIQSKSALFDETLSFESLSQTDKTQPSSFDPALFSKENLTDKGIKFSWSKAPLALPYDYGFYAFIYDSQTVLSPPQSFEELLTRKELKILISDPRTSRTGLGLLLWIKTLYEDQSTQTWKEIRPQIVTIAKGWSESYSLFQQGEADLVLSYTTSPAYHLLNENKTRYKALFFEEGHIPEIELITRTTVKEDPVLEMLSLNFIRHVLSPEMQTLIAETNWIYPIDHTNLPAVFQDLNKARPLQAKPFTLEERRLWLKEWLSAFK